MDTLGIQKCLQGGSQDSLQRPVNNPAQKFVLNFWSIIIATKPILQQIVTGDKTWVHHFEPESKRESMEWRHSSSPRSKEFKSQQSAGKVMVTIF